MQQIGIIKCLLIVLVAGSLAVCFGLPLGKSLIVIGVVGFLTEGTALHWWQHLTK